MIKPLHSFVVLSKNEVENKTTTGIILLNDGQPTYRCTVVAIGEGKGDEKPQEKLKEGDTVIVSKFARTTELTHEGKTYIVLPYADVIAVV